MLEPLPLPLKVQSGKMESIQPSSVTSVKITIPLGFH